ncbi:MAG: hypothetical protein JWN70_2476 [Planctomycetaceae bacterium]|nr:hypothetical protein [Planctomycetaceae bacterium]
MRPYEFQSPDASPRVGALCQIDFSKRPDLDAGASRPIFEYYSTRKLRMRFDRGAINDFHCRIRLEDAI